MKTFKGIIIGMGLLGSLVASPAFAERHAAIALEFNNVSFGAGTDRKAGEKIDKLLAKQIYKRYISSYKLKRWGREGEYTICVEYPSAALRSQTEKTSRAILKASRLMSVKAKLNCK